MSTTPDTESELPDDARARILEAAAALIASGGRDAATTRAVAAAAGVQAPTIYRLFGDKRGLLDAVTQSVMATYIARKATRVAHADPVQDLRDGWDMHLAFGLDHPGLVSILSGDPGSRAPAEQAGLDLLALRIRRIAQAGRLRVSEERAVLMMRAGCMGALLVLLGQPEGQRDTGLSVGTREAVIAAITGDSGLHESSGPIGAALALRASLDQVVPLSAGERLLLDELLRRIAGTS